MNGWTLTCPTTQSHGVVLREGGHTPRPARHAMLFVRHSEKAYSGDRKRAGGWGCCKGTGDFGRSEVSHWITKKGEFYCT